MQDIPPAFFVVYLRAAAYPLPAGLLSDTRTLARYCSISWGRVYAPMSKVMRSPVRSSGECRSNPDLSTIDRDDHESQITIRKRKHPDDGHGCCHNDGDIQDLRTEIARISKLVESLTCVNRETLVNVSEMRTQLVDMKLSNEQNFSSITHNVHEVKKQMNEIQDSMLNLAKEQKQIKAQMSVLEKKISLGEEKIKVIESDLANVKNFEPIASESQILAEEKVIHEVQERNNRQKNIIVAGINEQTSTNAKDRQSLDMDMVTNIISKLVKDAPPPIKVYRIGKYNPEKHRRIKVCFDSQNVPSQIIRNKTDLPKGIKIYSDLTPNQQKLMYSLQNELTRRQKSGETEITIKYIKGLPQIVKTNSKNQSLSSPKILTK